MDHFVTAAVFTYAHELTILKLLLEDAGIPYSLENETMTGIFPMYSQALGGIRLNVHPEDLETVKAIIKTLNDKITSKSSEGGKVVNIY